LNRYEGMFLFDAAVTRDWAEVEAEIKRLFDRIGAEQLACVKFDERKLAYEINKRKRGIYALTYFEAPPDRIVDLERDVQLSETVLRVLVLRPDKVTDERLAELRAHDNTTSLTPLSGDGRRHDDGRPDRRHDRDRPSDDRGRDRPAPRQDGPNPHESVSTTVAPPAPELTPPPAQVVPDEPPADSD